MSLNISELIDDKSQIRMMLIQMDMATIGVTNKELNEMTKDVKEIISDIKGNLTGDSTLNAIALTLLLDDIAKEYNTKKKNPAIEEF